MIAVPSTKTASGPSTIVRSAAVRNIFVGSSCHDSKATTA